MRSNFCDHKWQSQYTFKSHTPVKPYPIYEHSVLTKEAMPNAVTMGEFLRKALATVSRIARITGWIFSGILMLALFIPYMIAEVLLVTGGGRGEAWETSPGEADMDQFGEPGSGNRYSFTDPSTDTHFGESSYCSTINPASGLPMLSDDTSGVDVGGNPFGINMSDHY